MFPSLDRSFLIRARSLGSSKQAGQFSLIIGMFAERAKSVISDSRQYAKGRITDKSPALIL